ncbi:MAG: hypothetical protein DI596_14215 [Azospira oryzae]|nr:MAG: hypothetical protein DI596_14215 [Azospira oryzae]PZP76411.1 MAG: hypothetical protein DI593_14215 [Azospira oryzae]
MSNATTEPPKPELPDPVALARCFGDIAQRASKVLAEFVSRQAMQGQFGIVDELGIAKAFMDMAARLMSDPIKLAQAQDNITKLVEINQGLNTQKAAEFMRANGTHVRLVQISNRLRCNHGIDVTNWFTD